MRVSSALLAESATVVEGKLNIEGGFLRSYRAGIDRVATVTLVVFTEYEQSDANPLLTVEFVTPGGDAQAETVPMPQIGAAGEAGFALWPLWVPVETDGQYLLVVSGDTGSVRLPLAVHGE